MSNNNDRPVSDHHIANLDRHAEKIFAQLKANEWKLLSTPEMEPYEMKELLAEQTSLQGVLNWLSNIKMTLRPPKIVNPNNGNGGLQLVN